LLKPATGTFVLTSILIWDHEVLWYLKDADGLDRARLYDLDPSYLRRSGTRGWIKPAMRLFQATADADDVHTVWKKAADLELPVAELIEFVAKQVEHVTDREVTKPAIRKRSARG